MNRPIESGFRMYYGGLMRLLIVIWFCLGALGLGLVVLEASRRKMNISGFWYVFAVLLGPIFLFFVLPLWLGKWGRKEIDDQRRH